MYRQAKPLVRFLLRRFFKQITSTGATPYDQGPLIITSNHPNMMFDSFLIYLLYERDLWFLAKSTLFRNWLVSRILRKAHLIPVYRAIDGLDTANNKDTFRAAAAYLREGKGIAIFPEGASLGLRRILALKTGAARLAFQAEEESHFTLDLKIQPVGITYSDPVRFRSNVTIQIGEPILAKDYLASYREDPRGAVRALTQRIEEDLRNLTVEVVSDDLAPLLQKIQRLYGDSSNDLDRLQRIAKNVNALAPLYPELAKTYEARIDEVTTTAPEVLPKWWGALFPLVTVGVVLHAIPYHVTKLLAHRGAPPQVHLASNKFLYGVLIFPLWYLLLTLGITLATSLSTGVMVLIILFATGLLAEPYWEAWRSQLLRWLLPEHMALRTAERLALIAELEELRIDNENSHEA